MEMLKIERDGERASASADSPSLPRMDSSDKSSSDSNVENPDASYDSQYNPVEDDACKLMSTEEEDVDGSFHGFDVEDTSFHGFPIEMEVDASFHGFTLEMDPVTLFLGLKRNEPQFVHHDWSGRIKFDTSSFSCNSQPSIKPANRKQKRAKQFAKKPNKSLLKKKINLSKHYLNPNKIIQKFNKKRVFHKSNSTEQEQKLQEALAEFCETLEPDFKAQCTDSEYKIMYPFDKRKSNILVDATNFLVNKKSSQQESSIRDFSTPVKNEFQIDAIPFSSIAKREINFMDDYFHESHIMAHQEFRTRRNRAVTKESAVGLALGDLIVHWMTTGQVDTEKTHQCHFKNYNGGKITLDVKVQKGQNVKQLAANPSSDVPSSPQEMTVGTLPQPRSFPEKSHCSEVAVSSITSIHEIPYSCELKLQLDPSQPQPPGTIKNIFHEAFLSTTDRIVECFSGTLNKYISRVDKADNYKRRRLEQTQTGHTSEHPTVKIPTTDNNLEFLKCPEQRTKKKANTGNIPGNVHLEPSSLDVLENGSSTVEGDVLEKGSSAVEGDSSNSSCSSTNKKRNRLWKKMAYDLNQVSACRAKLQLKLNLPSSSNSSLSDHFVMEAELLEKPYLHGFQRSVVFRKQQTFAIKCDVYYKSPNSKIKMCSVQDLNKYFATHPELASILSSRNFDFRRAQHNVGLPYEIVRPASANHGRWRKAIKVEDPVDAFDFDGFCETNFINDFEGFDGFSETNSINDFEGFDQVEVSRSPDKLLVAGNCSKVKEETLNYNVDDETRGSNLSNQPLSHQRFFLSDGNTVDAPMPLAKSCCETAHQMNEGPMKQVDQNSDFPKIRYLKRKSTMLAEYLSTQSPKKSKVIESVASYKIDRSHVSTNGQSSRWLFPLPKTTEPPSLKAIFGCTLTPEKEPSRENAVTSSIETDTWVGATCVEPANQGHRGVLVDFETSSKPIKTESMPALECTLEPEPSLLGDSLMTHSIPIKTETKNPVPVLEITLDPEPSIISELTFIAEHMQTSVENDAEDLGTQVYSLSELPSTAMGRGEGGCSSQSPSGFVFIPFSQPFWLDHLESNVSDPDPNAGPIIYDPIDVQSSPCDGLTIAERGLQELPLNSNVLRPERNSPHLAQVREEDSSQPISNDKSFNCNSNCNIDGEDDEEIDVVNFTASPAKHLDSLGGNAANSEQPLEDNAYSCCRTEEERLLLTCQPPNHCTKDKQDPSSSRDPYDYRCPRSPLPRTPCQMPCMPLSVAHLSPIKTEDGSKPHWSPRSGISSNSSTPIKVVVEEAECLLSPLSSAPKESMSATTTNSASVPACTGDQIIEPVAIPSSSTNNPSEVVNEFMRQSLVIDRTHHLEPPALTHAFSRHGHYAFPGPPSHLSTLSAATPSGDTGIIPEPPALTHASSRHGHYAFPGPPSHVSTLSAATPYGDTGIIPEHYGVPNHNAVSADGVSVLPSRGSVPNVGAPRLITSGGQ